MTIRSGFICLFDSLKLNLSAQKQTFVKGNSLLKVNVYTCYFFLL